MSRPVVLSPPDPVGQHRVRRTDLLEPVFGQRATCVGVGVMLSDESAVGPLERVLGAVVRDTEDGVEVLRQPVVSGHVDLSCGVFPADVGVVRSIRRGSGVRRDGHREPRRSSASSPVWHRQR
jgi:hypothetical protein